MGFEVVDEFSLMDGSNPELLEMISNRIAVLYDLLYEDDEGEETEVDDDEEEEYADIEEALNAGSALQTELERLIDEAEEDPPIDLDEDHGEAEEEDTRAYI